MVCSGSGRLPQLSSSFRAELLDRVRIMCSKTPIGATLKGKLRRKFIFYSIKAHIFDENRQVSREIYKMSEFHFRNSAFVVQCRVTNSGGLAGKWRFGTFLWRAKIFGAGSF